MQKRRPLNTSKFRARSGDILKSAPRERRIYPSATVSTYGLFGELQYFTDFPVPAVQIADLDAESFLNRECCNYAAGALEMMYDSTKSCSKCYMSSGRWDEDVWRGGTAHPPKVHVTILFKACSQNELVSQIWI